MNNAIVSKTKTKSLPHFPVLSVGKTKRVVTKHFTNLALWLPADEFALLNFLVYQADASNTIKYSTKLMERYSAAVKASMDEYWDELEKRGHYYIAHLQNNRYWFIKLVEKGLLLHTAKRHYFMLNPMLTYDSQIVNNKKYEEFSEYYQGKSTEEITTYFTTLVSDFLSAKKKNYKHGNKK